MKKRKCKLYSVLKDSEVYAVSLVEEPAIESDFIYLSKQSKARQIALSSIEKHIVCGVVLKPDFPILRYDENGEEFYIQFPKETIEKLSYDFMEEGRIYNFTTHHKDVVDSISVVESWIKTSENDKSTGLGLDAPVGSWLMTAKINDEEIWQDIKCGKMKGFSIESFLNMEQIMLSKNNNTEMAKETNTKLETVEVNDDFFSKILDAIKGALQSPAVPEMEANITAEQFIEEVKDEVNVDEVISEDAVEETPVEEMPVEEAPVEEMPQEEAPQEAEEIAEEVVEEVKDVVPSEEDAKETIQAIVDELNLKIEDLNAQIEELRKENMTLSKENEKFSKRPSAKPINVNASKNSENKFDLMLSIMNGSAFK